MGNNARRKRRQDEKWRTKPHLNRGVEVWCWRYKRGTDLADMITPSLRKIKEWWKATIELRTGQVVYVAIPSEWMTHSHCRNPFIGHHTDRINITQCDIHRPKCAKTGHKRRSRRK